VSEDRPYLRLIVNADDLGISKDVNTAIFDMMSRKLVTSATILANGPEVEEAVSGSLNFPECSFGVHLNIMEHRPIIDNPDLAPLLNTDGEFAEKALEISLDRTVQQAVVGEWIAQIGALRAYGVKISHIDSHFHTHNLPSLFYALKQVQQHTGIAKVRITKNIYSASNPPATRFLLIRKKLWNLALRKLVSTQTTDGFTELSTFMEKAVGGIPSKYRTIELMTHPGCPENNDETAILGGEWLKQLPFDVRLINYNEL